MPWQCLPHTRLRLPLGHVLVAVWARTPFRAPAIRFAIGWKYNLPENPPPRSQSVESALGRRIRRAWGDASEPGVASRTARKPPSGLFSTTTPYQSRSGPREVCAMRVSLRADARGLAWCAYAVGGGGACPESEGGMPITPGRPSKGV
ncbi:hypothetical protein DFH07DRAFT_954315 [Mycena maculata]|uniref:Uncharacterized protein n=1 Tax=Mycena maculata TaxID=230809 RepID=A0AAD7NNY9_9AGAR|nr:hypothetical protein DFH07DRAFT_954315 [Mycena maculata]